MVRFSLSAMMPGTDRLPGAAELGLEAFVQRFLSETSWLMWWGTMASALAFMCTPLFTVYLPVPAVLLPASLLDRHADRIAQHPFGLLRQSGLLLKMVMGLHWAAHPVVREAFSLPAYPEDPGTWRVS